MTIPSETNAEREDRLWQEQLRMYRASHLCVCDDCGREYWRHPNTDHRDNTGQPYMRKLCNGDIVKL